MSVYRTVADCQELYAPVNAERTVADCQELYAPVNAEINTENGSGPLRTSSHKRVSGLDVNGIFST
jgi:hypothetical protein